MEKPNADVAYTCGSGYVDSDWGSVSIDASVCKVVVDDGLVILSFHKDLAPEVVSCIKSVFDLD